MTVGAGIVAATVSAGPLSYRGGNEAGDQFYRMNDGLLLLHFTDQATKEQWIAELSKDTK